MTDKPERHAIISGVGQSAIGRRLFRTDLDLTCEAALAAIADAGLRPDDIDGIAAYPGPIGGAAGLRRAGHLRGAGVPRHRPALASLRRRGPGADLADHPRHARGRRRAVPARAGLPHGDRGDRGGRHRPARHRRGLARDPRLRRLPDPVRRDVGRQLAGALRPPAHARVRHHARAPRPDRHHRAAARGAQPEGDLSRADDAWTTTSRRAW